MIAIHRIIKGKGNRIKRFVMIFRFILQTNICKSISLGFEHSQKILRNLNFPDLISYLLPTCQEKLSAKSISFYEDLRESGS